MVILKSNDQQITVSVKRFAKSELLENGEAFPENYPVKSDLQDIFRGIFGNIFIGSEELLWKSVTFVLRLYCPFNVVH
ncbi:hypothetical protein T10_13132 [Trichinella papuae]|uniref:Uncharacterized protein n=1 Tax=Trichinella papuae TaxID=268474 RepID=A0A0V1MP51_9BILA|nr:hypothetical protein T10_13132 [Trichinella papuae]